MLTYQDSQNDTGGLDLDVLSMRCSCRRERHEVWDEYVTLWSRYGNLTPMLHKP